jgi:septal ring factor EnvC (AmiA/AmiB activator)
MIATRPKHEWNTNVNNEKSTPDRTSGLSANWTHFLYAGLILLVCVAFYQGTQTENLLRRITSSQRDNEALRKNLARSEQEFRESLVRFHTELAELQGELAVARQETYTSLKKAQAATMYADTLAGRLEKKRRDQENRQQQLSAELSKVETSADETSLRLNGISSEVGGVKDALESVRADATKNVADLDQTRGDLSVLKNGIAKNAKQIQMLREQGEKSIFEFSLTKADGLQRVGDIQMKLTRANEKHNTFTVEILADDRLIEKRDKTINEPVEFFVASKSGQPYDLVVNEVGKNSVKGYLAKPNETIAR